MIWLSFIVLTWVDHHSFHFLIAFFCIPLPLSRSSFHFLSIPYLLIPITDWIPFSHHSCISLMVWPFILSLISLSTFPLVTSKSMTHEIFLCVTSCTRGYGFDHWVFEPSFPSFLSPYHLGLRYVLCLKTTLRPRDQTLSLTVFTWTGFLVDWLKFGRYYALFYGRYFWKHLVSLLLSILMFDGFLGLETVHWGY